jgi:hypothetical protein
MLLAGFFLVYAQRASRLWPEDLNESAGGTRGSTFRADGPNHISVFLPGVTPRTASFIFRPCSKRP